MVFTVFILFVILLRLGELLLARRNERWLLQHGAVEYGKKHYRYIVLLHVGFFISLITEYVFTSTGYYSIPLLVLYFVLLGFKAWTIFSLGRFWNTKIFRIPGYPLVKKGAYKFIKHPNYIIVIAEIALIPLIFHLYITAIVFSGLNALMLHVRIKEENKVLAISVTPQHP
ncbi:isoprenylcysteine carboxyl methyltransferase family protein [Parabacteroides pacaensis]|uniref:isoprenylcysteine carboxyl methyltransferase family protein n=1 Tax=Parabacteroides pacaensis TaxID=2086575 RepID=UPI000D10E2F0|nr:isoprenylcysteine carboxylmethyltransferase family protein [Parabacteroides pacaensis]